MKNALYALFGVIAGFLLAGVLVFVSRAPEGEPIVLQPAPTEAPIEVHVIGAVLRPDLYKFPEGARVQDAIDAAGGLLAEANVDALNLARLLEDGEQLNIPYKAGSEPVDSRSPALELPGATEAPAANSDLINVNTATLEELDTLPGIGPSTAQKIIDYRNQNGPFSVVEDLLNVSGIGPATLENIRNLVTTGN
jgi:competence protein ComEA